MKLLVLSQLPPPIHGSTRMTSWFMEALEQEHSLFLVDRRFSSSIGDVGKFQITKCLKAVTLVLRILTASIRYRPDAAVIFLTSSKFSFLVDAACVAVLRLRGIQIVHYIHTVGFSELAETKIGGVLVARVMGAARRVVCLSPRLTGDVERFLDPQALDTIPNCVADPLTSERAPSSSTPPVILFVSNLLPSKGADTFVELCGRVSETRPEVRYHLVGDAPDPDLQRQLSARALALGLKIDFKGRLTASGVMSELLGATLLVFPSRYAPEAQPLTIIEAKAAGLPCVAFGVGGIPELVQDGVDGFVVAPEDLPALAARAIDVLQDEALRSRLASGARSSYERNHSLDQYRSNWLRCLEKMEASR